MYSVIYLFFSSWKLRYLVIDVDRTQIHVLIVTTCYNGMSPCLDNRRHSDTI